MKKRSLLVTLLVFTALSSSAQLGNVAGKAKKSVVNKVEEKIEPKNDPKPATPAETPPAAKENDTPATGEPVEKTPATPPPPEPPKPTFEEIRAGLMELPVARLAPGDQYYQASDPLSGFQQKHVGQILFANAKTDKATMTDATFKNSFTSGEHIEARIFLETSICNYLTYTRTATKGSNNMNDFKCSMSTYLIINGDRSTKIKLDTDAKFEGEDRSLTCYRETVYATDANKKYNRERIVDALNKLPIGTYSIEMEVWAGDSTTSYYSTSLKPVCTGSFTYVKKTAANLSYGQKFTDIKAFKKDPVFEKKALDYLISYGTANGFHHKYLATMITSDWTVHYEAYSNRILNRTIHVYAKAKHQDGKCYMYEYELSQAYNNGKYVPELNYEGLLLGSERMIDCD